MRKIVLSFSVPQFVEVQRQSFLNLLKEGIPTEINRQNPTVIVINKSDLKKHKDEKKAHKDYRFYRKYSPKKITYYHAIFYGNYYKLMRPKGTIKDAVLNGKTYSARLYVPVDVKLVENSTIQPVLKKKWVFLGHLPLMTTRGHFIINGSPRVILHQMVRSPGVYFHEVVDIYKDKRKVYADIICQRGVWLRMEIDQKGLIWVKMKKYSKIPILHFLQSFGLEHPHFLAQLSSPFLDSEIHFKNEGGLHQFLKWVELEKNPTVLTPKSSLILEPKLSLVASRQRLLKKKAIFLALKFFFLLYFPNITNNQKKRLLSSDFFLNIFRKIKHCYQERRPLQQSNRGLEPSTNIKALWDETEIKYCFMLKNERMTPKQRYKLVDREIKKLRAAGVKGKELVNAVRKGPNYKSLKCDTVTNLLKLEKQQVIKSIVWLNHVKKKFKSELDGLKGEEYVNAITENPNIRAFFKEQGFTDPNEYSLDLINKFHNKTKQPLLLPASENLKKAFDFHATGSPTQRVNDFVTKPSFLPILFELKKPNTLENQISLMYQIQMAKNYFYYPWQTRKKKITILAKAKKVFKSKMRAQLGLSKFITMEDIYSVGDRELIKNYKFWKHGEPGSEQWLNKNAFNTLLYNRYQRGEPGAYEELINHSKSQFFRYDNWKKGKDILLNTPFKGKDETEVFECFDDFFSYLKTDSLSRTRQFLIKKFLSSKAYNLGPVGRKQINRKFGLNKSLTQMTLTLDDFICMINYLRQVKSGVMPADDIDNLKNRRVRSSCELIQTQLGNGLNSFCKKNKKPVVANSKKKALKELEKRLNSKHLDLAFKEFFHSSPLSQFMDETNPLAEITHKRRLSSLGPGGITQATAGMKIRSIHPTYYGRICPIETPEGLNAGLVNSLATYARVNSDGFLESPFYKVSNGQVHKNNDYVVFLSAGQAEIENIASGDVPLNPFNRFIANEIPIMINNEFSEVSRNEVDFMSISRIQMISIATSLIPFVEHDDANRALMGSNMQRQSVPLLNPERPIVGTGLEGRVLCDSSQGIQAKYSGVVTYASSEKIKIFSFLKTKNLTFKGLSTIYFLKNYEKSNQNTCISQRPLVQEGDWIEKGSCLADSSSTSKGELAVGKNILVAYLPWEGYNFEDAILISERLIYDHLFTSVHIAKYLTEIRETPFGQERILKELFDWDLNLTDSIKDLDDNGIIKIGSWVNEGDILVRKITPIDAKKFSPYYRFLYLASGHDIPESEDSSLRVPKGVHGRVIAIKMRKTRNVLVSNSLGPEAVVVWIAEKKAIQVGDKMSGRHGNKGIVSRILAREDMPYLSDGTPVDMVLNPLGVPSRMNVGQIYEALLGLAGKHLKQNYKVTPFDEISGHQASRSLVFSKLAEAKKKTGKKWLFEPQNPGKMRVFDGRTGESFDQPVTVGQPYILKLIHMVDDKIHARATGPYSLVTQQPLRGRSKKGGQRFGEMEVWALEGFGAAYTLQEILTIKSDDIPGRKQVMDSFLSNEKITIGRPESFRVLIRELQSLCLQVNVYNAEKQFIDVNSEKFNCYQVKSTSIIAKEIKNKEF
jgi:DNA-directed RNA polymerase subunit beta